MNKEMKSAVKMVETFGATQRKHLHGKDSYWLELQTAHGPVTVSIMKNWTHIRIPPPLIGPASAFDPFDKPNPYSGKWNVMFDNEQRDELRRRLLWITEQ